MRMFFLGIALMLTAWEAARASENAVLFTDLQEREGRFYQADSESPYSGLFREAYPTGETKVEGALLDGLRHGPATSFLQNGIKTTVETFANGEKNGPSVIFYPSRRKSSETTFVNGVENGHFKSWRKNGNPWNEGNYVDGEKDGLWTKWHANGNKEWEETYSLGILDGVSRRWWYGKKTIEVSYVDGSRHGLVTKWHSNGYRKDEVMFDKGIESGPSTSWYLDGQVKNEQTYENGERQGLMTYWDVYGIPTLHCYDAGKILHEGPCDEVDDLQEVVDNPAATAEPVPWIGDAPEHLAIARYGILAGGWRDRKNPRLVADVNNDGRADIIGFGDTGILVSLSTATATTAGFQAPQRVVTDMCFTAGGWQVTDHPRMMADVNNDGRADIVGFGGGGTFVALSMSTGVTASFGPAQLVIHEFGTDDKWMIKRHPRMMADVNGDGRADIVGFKDDGVYVSLSASTATEASFQASVKVLAHFARKKGKWDVRKHPRMMADVNGDGRADIVGFANDGVYVSLSASTESAPAFQAPVLVVPEFGYKAGNWRVDQHPRLMADINHDGRDDIIGFGQDGVYVSLSMSSDAAPNFQSPQKVIADLSRETGWDVRKNKRMMADLNNDGRADIVGFANKGVVVLFSTSTADVPEFAAPETVVQYVGTDAGFSAEYHPRFVTDINADGKADLIEFGRPGTFVYLIPGED